MPRDRSRDRESARETAELLAFLTDPAAHRERPDRIETIETHAAYVILAGPAAYKIKKPVKLPFLDFSTHPRRHQALARELELNREHAPEIYRGLVAINRGDDGTLTFGAGTPVDTALAMNRFPQEDLLARIAADGPLSAPIARDLAEMVARYHRAVPLATGTPGAAVMRQTVGALAASLAEDAPPALAPLADAFARLSLADVERLAPLLEARRLSGQIRRCHGDLHLGNIVLRQGHAVPFDALEFDENLASIDVMYDLAFLLMDLDVRGDRQAANIVLNTYVTAAPTGGEIDGLAALPLFLGTRAAIRALVSLERALQKPESEAEPDIARAARYLTAANRYLTPAKPMLVAVGGLSGTGKSTLSAGLAPLIGPAPGALVLRTDVERKRLFEVPTTERLAPEQYSEQASDFVYAVLYEKTERALAAGHAVIFDGVSAKQAERETLAAIAERTQTRFAGLWLEAALDIQIARVEARRGDASDSTEAVVRAQAERDLGEITWTRIDAGQSADHTLAQAQAVLGLPGGTPDG